jgi:hypothetical protein
MRRRTALGAAVLVALAAGALGAAGAGGHGRRAAGVASGYHVQIRPANFTTRIDNPWLPFLPGTKYINRSMPGRRQRDVVTATHTTRVIDRVRCVVVHDYTYSAGRITTRTSDYYAQDRHGNVWYFGESNAEINAHGQVTSRADSWRAGVDGAQPGLFMPRHPRVGARHRQEYYRGHAEDRYRIASRRARVRVPFGSFTRVLETKEFSRLEPGVVDRDYYVRGIGQVLERGGDGGRTALVKVRHVDAGEDSGPAGTRP